MSFDYSQKGAQWLSGRVLDSRPKDLGFEPHWRHCFVSLSKTHCILLSTGSTQEDPSRHIWKIVDWDVKNQIKQTNLFRKINLSRKFPNLQYMDGPRFWFLSHICKSQLKHPWWHPVGLIFILSDYLHPYFVYVSSEGSGESACTSLPCLTMG